MKRTIHLAAVLAVLSGQSSLAIAGALSVDSGMPFFPVLTASGVESANGGRRGQEAGKFGGAGKVADATAAAVAAGGQPGAASPAVTAAITDGLLAATLFCGSITAAEYRVDCLAERLAEVARTLPTEGDYAAAQAAIDAASRDLAALAAAHRSRDLPRSTARSGGANPVATSRPLTPVAAADLADVNLQATAILAETETLLLRSTENSAARQIAYQQIAAAVGSGKVLLRSS